MFSVIIPTLWMSEKTPELLRRLNGCPDVGEIILIDNRPSARPSLGLDKLRVLNQNRNIYVNPAWNLGVMEAKNENLCVCNDDVLFNMEIFSFMEKNLRGIIGQWTDNYYLKKDGEYKVEPISGRPSGWGCLMFVKKSDWVDIPDNLLIACGDDFLIKNIRESYKLTGLRIDTKMSTTSLRPEFNTIQENDIINYNKNYSK